MSGKYNLDQKSGDGVTAPSLNEFATMSTYPLPPYIHNPNPTQPNYPYQPSNPPKYWDTPPLNPTQPNYPSVGRITNLHDIKGSEDVLDMDKLIREFIEILTDIPTELLETLRADIKSDLLVDVSAESAKRYIKRNDVLNKIENIIQNK